MDIFPKFSVLSSPPEPKYEQETAEDLADIYSLAQNRPDAEARQENIYRLVSEGSEGIKAGIAESRNASLPQEARQVLDYSLANGSVDAAIGILKGVPAESTDAAVANAASENAMEPRLDEPNEYFNIAQDSETNAKILILNEKLLQFRADIDKAYAPSKLEAEAQSITEGLPYPTIPKGTWKLLGDMLVNLVPVIGHLAYQWDKAPKETVSKALGGVIAPGHSAKAMADAVFDPEVPLEKFISLVDNESDRLRKEFSDDADANPSNALGAFMERMFSGQVEYKAEVTKKQTPAGEVTERKLVPVPNPYIERLRSIKEYAILDEDGNLQYKPNMLADYYNPNDPVDRIMYGATFQDVADSFMWDIQALRAMRLSAISRTIIGKEGNAKVIANNILMHNPDLEDRLHAVQIIPPGVDPDVGYEIQKQFDIMESAVQELIDPQRVTPTNAQIVARQTELSDDLFPIAPVTRGNALTRNNLVSMTPSSDGGNSFMDILMQAPSGRPFRSDAQATAYAQQLGLTAFRIENRGPDFFLKIKYAVDDEGYLDPNMNPQLYKPQFIDRLLGTTTRWAKYFPYSPLVTTTGEAVGRSTSANLESVGLANAFARLNQPLRDLDANAQGDLSTIILRGMKTLNPKPNMPLNRGKEFTPVELDLEYTSLRGTPATKKEQTAYYALMNSNKLAHALKEKEIYDKLAAHGYNHWVLDNSPFGSPVVANTVQRRDLVPDGAMVLTPTGVLKKTSFNSLNQPDTVMLKLYSPIEVQGVNVSHVLYPSGQIRTTGLDRNVLGRVEGGPREYGGKVYVKQQRDGRNAFTLSNHMSYGKANKYIADVEKIKNLYKNYRASLNNNLSLQQRQNLKLQVDTAIGAVHPAWSLQRIQNHVTAGELDLDVPLLSRHDREMMPNSVGLEDGLPEMYLSGGKMYVTERGEYLEDETGGLAELAHPYEALARQQARAAKDAGYSNFVLREQIAWGVRYSKYLQPLPEGIAGTALNKFRHAKFFEGKTNDFTQEMQNQAEALRLFLKRASGQPTPLMAQIQNIRYQGSINASKIFGDQNWLPDRFFKQLKTGEIVSSADAHQFLKGVAYNMHLGLFDTGQYLIQASGAIPALSMYPQYTKKVIELYIPIRIAAAMDFNSHLVGAIQTNLQSVGTYSAEFLDIITDYKLSKVHDIGHTDALRDLGAFVSPVTGGTTGEFLEAGRVPMVEGERAARIAGFIVARERAKELVAAGKLVQGSAEYHLFNQTETARLGLNMMRGAEAHIQREFILSLAFQMKQFGMKMNEIFLGINRSLTRKEKSAVDIGQLLTFGPGAGIVGYGAIDYFGEKTQEWTGEKVDKDAVALWYFGMLDKAIKETTGQALATGDRLGAGNTISQVWEMMTLQDGAWTTLGMAGGDLDKMALAGESIKDAIGASIALAAQGKFDPSMLTGDVASDIGKMISSFSRAEKAYMLWKYRVRQDSAGNIKDYNANLSSMMAFLGLSYEDEVFGYRIVLDKMQRKEVAKKMAKRLAPLVVQSVWYYKAGDLRSAEAVNARISTLMAPFVDDPELYQTIQNYGKLGLEGMQFNNGPYWEEK